MWVSESFYELMKMGNKNDKSKSKLTKKKKKSYEIFLKERIINRKIWFEDFFFGEKT